MSAGVIGPSPMGIFKVRVGVYSLRDERKIKEIETTVDTGALFPVLPRELLGALDAERIETRTFVLANGQEITRDVGQVGVEYEGHRTPTAVVLGEKGDAVLLGALALEGLGYEVDTVHKTLRPTTLFLLGARPRAPSSSY